MNYFLGFPPFGLQATNCKGHDLKHKEINELSRMCVYEAYVYQTVY